MRTEDQITMLRAALEACVREWGVRDCFLLHGEKLALEQARRALLDSPVDDPWCYDMEAAPKDKRLWIAVDANEGLETLIGFAFESLGHRFYETDDCYEVFPYAWTLYDAPEPPAPPNVKEIG